MTMLVSIALIAGHVTPAAAQGTGVFVDPDSPSGKEYAIPLEGARRQADPQAPTGKPGGPAVAPATLFGEGVVSSRRDGGKAADKRRSSGSEKRRAQTTEPKSPPVPDVVSIAAARPGTPEGGIGTPALVLGLGALVLLVGVLAGVLIRRRSEA